MNGTLKPLAIFFLALAMLSSTIAAADEVTESIEKFYNKLDNGTFHLTRLNYYVHTKFGEMVFQIASSELTPTSASGFGMILVVDNKLTTGSDLNSQEVGRYQGMNAFSDLQNSAANMNMNFIFTAGDYKGSTISIQGRQPSADEVRVISVVGGTGAFRFARGTALARTLSKADGLYIYDIFVVTPVVVGEGVERSAV